MCQLVNLVFEKHWRLQCIKLFEFGWETDKFISSPFFFFFEFINWVPFLFSALQQWSEDLLLGINPIIIYLSLHVPIFFSLCSHSLAFFYLSWLQTLTTHTHTCTLYFPSSLSLYFSALLFPSIPLLLCPFLSPAFFPPSLCPPVLPLLSSCLLPPSLHFSSLLIYWVVILLAWLC